MMALCRLLLLLLWWLLLLLLLPLHGLAVARRPFAAFIRPTSPNPSAVCCSALSSASTRTTAGPMVDIEPVPVYGDWEACVSVGRRLDDETGMDRSSLELGSPTMTYVRVIAGLRRPIRYDDV